jgi:hypothetical protein
MRKRYRVLIFSAIVAALVVPLGFALSLESDSAVSDAPRGVMVVASTAVTAAPIVTKNAAAVPLLSPIPDSAKLFALGTALFGLAAAVRKAM